jgi:hypothetical protein
VTAGTNRESTRKQDRVPARWIIAALILGSVLIGAVGFYSLTRPREATGEPSVASGAPVWRVEGRIADASSIPIADACVAIGPRGCQRLGPHSGADGLWFFDFPQVAVTYDLHFSKQGYRQVDLRIDLTGPRRIDVVLERSP